MPSNDIFTPPSSYGLYKPLFRLFIDPEDARAGRTRRKIALYNPSDRYEIGATIAPADTIRDRRRSNKIRKICDTKESWDIQKGKKGYAACFHSHNIISLWRQSSSLFGWRKSRVGYQDWTENVSWIIVSSLIQSLARYHHSKKIKPLRYKDIHPILAASTAGVEQLRRDIRELDSSGEMILTDSVAKFSLANVPSTMPAPDHRPTVYQCTNDNTREEGIFQKCQQMKDKRRMSVRPADRQSSKTSEVNEDDLPDQWLLLKDFAFPELEHQDFPDDAHRYEYGPAEPCKAGKGEAKLKGEESCHCGSECACKTMMLGCTGQKDSLLGLEVDGCDDEDDKRSVGQ